MKGLAAVLIIAILALTFLLYVWTARRRTARRAELRLAEQAADRAADTLYRIGTELGIQEAAGVSDISPIRTTLRDHVARTREIHP